MALLFEQPRFKCLHIFTSNPPRQQRFVPPGVTSSFSIGQNLSLPHRALSNPPFPLQLLRSRSEAVTIRRGSHHSCVGVEHFFHSLLVPYPDFAFATHHPNSDPISRRVRFSSQIRPGLGEEVLFTNFQLTTRKHCHQQSWSMRMNPVAMTVSHASYTRFSFITALL